MTRILVLTAGFGDGHNTAAHSIREALEQSPGNNQVEVVDLFRHSYGLLNTVARQTYYGLINHAPSVWGGIFWLLDRTARWKYSSTSLGRATRDLASLISQTNPDCVLATYPAYTPMIEAIYPDAGHRPFLLGVVVTDSITVNAAWYAAPADFYCVANAPTVGVLERAGVPTDRIHAFGFPVSARFAEPADPADEWEPGRTFRILQILNHGTRKAVKTARRLLEVPRSHLTIVTGRNPKLRRKLEAATADQADRVTVLGWTDRIPELMRQSHLIVTKAGGATVQEALAAGRPVILTQVVPGQEEGNAQFVRAHGMGAVARRPKEVGRIVVQALKHRGYQFRQWRRNKWRSISICSNANAAALGCVTECSCLRAWNSTRRDSPPATRPTCSALASTRRSIHPCPCGKSWPTSASKTAW